MTTPTAEEIHFKLEQYREGELAGDELSREWVGFYLMACEDPECLECGRIICPHGDPMHFHHDGCPTCAQHEGASA